VIFDALKETTRPSLFLMVLDIRCPLFILYIV
jgi:hypothetical protein